jgi:hypothetical protein
VGTLIAWTIGRLFIQAIDSLCQQAGSGRLASAARACKQVCMYHMVTGDGIAQRLDNMLLSNNIIPLEGAPLVI